MPLKNIVLSLLIALLSTPALALGDNRESAEANEAAELSASFREDEQQQLIATEHAAAFVSYIEKNFGHTLDYSDESIRKAEQYSSFIYEILKQRGFPEDAVLNNTYGLGAYIGEVARRNHGATWGVSVHDGEELIVMRKGSHTFWPHGRAHRRFTRGDEDNVLVYYQSLVASFNGG